MRPQTIKADLPSAHDVKICLQNEFVDHLNKLKATIMVSRVATPNNFDNSPSNPRASESLAKSR